jgi:hypothetical protein
LVRIVGARYPDVMGYIARALRMFRRRPLTPEEMAELAESKRIRAEKTEDRLSQTSAVGQVYRAGESRSEREQRY